MQVKVCIGSACHLKGSYDVINGLKRKIAENQLEGKVELKASFCLGKCSDAVSIQIDDLPVQSISMSTIDNFFTNYIESRL